MHDLVAFLNARLSEDAALARAVDDRSEPWDGQWTADESGNALRTVNGHVLVYGHNHPLKPGLVDHMARHDPARVLREVDAKRLILAEHEPVFEGAECPACVYRSPCTTLSLLALPYDDHTDYREEWRPE
ncbi:DUF6221 family protein [Nonomuraea sp. MTCD27]|uniref:DUF6221 family protein n=1 Tax=Nonomuraea sp. MTCD27 TaxID=1676747 RepID=UPI0035BF215D